MNYADEDLLMISALQHLAFCERRCALTHLEQQWAENRHTVLGEILHERVHGGEKESRGDRISVRSLRLVSYRLGLTGQADVVEFKRSIDGRGVSLPNREGRWLPYPVEYKKGKPKEDGVYEVQLCAQALCLEEQLSVEIPEGALFYGAEKRRHPVSFSPELRKKTGDLAERLHDLIRAGKTPPAVYSSKCKSCSLMEVCQPKWKGVMKRERYEELLFEEEDKRIVTSDK
ncbi:MAG: CRISPR-associated protein Cas4 [Nitrospinae bacterium]|nr:CRISPR-associated protein Cas4 [Nitrospinota bacterium]